MPIHPTATNYTSVDLLAWSEQGVLTLSPKFQRRPVWKPAAKSYFLDTLLRGFPAPPVHIRLTHDSVRGVGREVIDGQQRLRTLFDFMAGRFRLSPQLDADWASKTFDRLSLDDQANLKLYRFPVYEYQGVDDQTILEIFARINTYSVALNAQELRNGRYFGVFKNTVYSLALEHLQAWRSLRLFTESAIARMSEAELVSELLVLQFDGQQDKKSSLEEYYAHLDEGWPADRMTWTTRGLERPTAWVSRAQAVERFRATMGVIQDWAGDLIPTTEFHRIPLFYTLFAAVQHRLYGLPKFFSDSPLADIDQYTALRLRGAIEELSSLVADKPADELLNADEQAFVVAAARQTDNLAPRNQRLAFLWDAAKLSD